MRASSASTDPSAKGCFTCLFESFHGWTPLFLRLKGINSLCFELFFQTEIVEGAGILKIAAVSNKDIPFSIIKFSTSSLNCCV